MQGQRWRHIRRQTIYEIIATGLMQDAAGNNDNRQVIIYRGEDGRVWVRLASEFFDGRFEKL